MSLFSSMQSVPHCHGPVYDSCYRFIPLHSIVDLMLTKTQIGVNNKETMGVVLIGVEAIARLLLRCAIYEKLYLKSGPRLSICQNLEFVRGELYIVILGFLAFAKRYLDKSSSGMSSPSHIGRVPSCMC